MITDFFHPAVGGVENHIYMLAANLIQRGHKASQLMIALKLLSLPGHSDNAQSPT